MLTHDSCASRRVVFADLCVTNRAICLHVLFATLSFFYVGFVFIDCRAVIFRLLCCLCCYPRPGFIFTKSNELRCDGCSEFLGKHYRRTRHIEVVEAVLTCKIFLGKGTVSLHQQYVDYIVIDSATYNCAFIVITTLAPFTLFLFWSISLLTLIFPSNSVFEHYLSILSIDRSDQHGQFMS